MQVGYGRPAEDPPGAANRTSAQVAVQAKPRDGPV